MAIHRYFLPKLREHIHTYLYVYICANVNNLKLMLRISTGMFGLFLYNMHACFFRLKSVLRESSETKAELFFPSSSSRVNPISFSLSATSKMAQNDSLPEFLASAVDAAKKAGEVIREGFYEAKNVEHKGLVDLVTETDKACEDIIFSHLKQLYPTHKFIGEETTAAYGATELTDEPTWIVDPLDGTTNFVHRFPFVCVSIGLTIGKVPSVGVVYNPIMEELFTGIRGKGAFLNGKPIKASQQTELVKCLLVAEDGTQRDKQTLDAFTNRINSLLTKVRSIRICGSCALNLCGIACGRLDIFYLIGFGGPWDVAAGAVIVLEAGGHVFDPSGKDFDLTSQRVAASNAFIKDAFVEALRQSE